MAHRLTRDELPLALTAWACLTGFAEPLRDALPASLGWLRACWDAGDDHLPLHLVHDLGYLLLRGRDFRFASTRQLAQWPDDERADRLAYEDRVLGRWALDPTVLEAHIAIAGMPPVRRDAAIAHAVGLALGASLAGIEHAAHGNPAHLRGLPDDWVTTLPEDFTGLRETVDDAWLAWARDQRDEAAKALPPGRLFRPDDLWEIAHLAELPSESARIALRRVNGMAARIGPVTPSVALSVRHTAREVPVEAEESDHYPAGGFDAISTRGSFENLVRSEVSYVGEGTDMAGGIDLFDVRFAENELLFYTRDESPLLDARRDVTLVIDRPAELRHKVAELPEQTLVLVEAVAMALQADLMRVFGAAGSKMRVVWRVESAHDRTAADEERALLALTLAAEVAHRRVELSVVEAWSEVPEVGRVVCSPRASDANIAHVAWVRVGDAAWTALDASYDVREGPPALRALADALLVAVSKRRVIRGRKAKRAKVA